MIITVAFNDILKEVIFTPRTKSPPLDDNTIQEVVKHRRPKRSEDLQVHTDPGDNTKYISNAMLMWNWTRPDMTNPEAVEQRANEYFRLCAENDVKPSVAGFAFAFDTDRKTMWKWVNGLTKSIPTEVVDTIKKSYRILNILMEDYMQNGKINPVSGIFLMKNNMGYSDQTEIIVTPNNPLGEVQDPDTIAEKYKYLPTE